jgi:hypothetical protein
MSRGGKKYMLKYFDFLLVITLNHNSWIILLSSIYDACALKTCLLIVLLLHQVYIKDTDERACAYIAGPAPNRWGFATEGNDLFNVIQRSDADGNSNPIWYVLGL